jgi:hypothetical protein
MTDDEGTEVSTEEINASMQESFVCPSPILYTVYMSSFQQFQYVPYETQSSDSPVDAQSAEESEGDADEPKGQKGTFQREDEPPKPTNMGDARSAARVNVLHVYLQLTNFLG